MYQQFCQTSPWRHNDINLTSKMIENAQNCQFLSCKWPQYRFLMVFMMVYIDFCSLLVCQMNIYPDSTHIDNNWYQFNVRIIENTQNHQFVLCKWPIYHFLTFFFIVLKYHLIWSQLRGCTRYYKYTLQFIKYTPCSMLIYIEIASFLECWMNFHWNNIWIKFV